MVTVIMVRMLAHHVPHLMHHNQDHKGKQTARIQRQQELRKLQTKKHQIKIRLPIIQIRNPILQRLVVN